MPDRAYFTPAQRHEWPVFDAPATPPPKPSWYEVKVADLPERIRARDARGWIEYLMSIEPTAYEIMVVKPFTLLVLPTEAAAAEWVQS